VTTLTYDSKDRILDITNAKGIKVLQNEYTIVWQYPLPEAADVFNVTELTKMTDAQGNEIKVHWEANFVGQTSTTGYTDALGYRHGIKNNQKGATAGLPNTNENPNGSKFSAIYDDDGNQTSRTETTFDDNGDVVEALTTHYEYNANGDITKTTDPLGFISQTEYNAVGDISAEIDNEGHRTEYQYDDRENIILVTYPNGTTRQTTYDVEDNKIAETDVLGNTTKWVYDELGRVVETLYPDKTPNDDRDNPRTSSTYNEIGKLIKSTNELGNSTHYQYDEVGNNIQVTDALGNITRYVYNELNLQIQSIDALGRITYSQYDNKNRLIATLYPDNTPDDLTDNLKTTQTYDALDRKISQTDMAGNTTLFEYDSEPPLLMP